MRSSTKQKKEVDNLASYQKLERKAEPNGGPNNSFIFVFPATLLWLPFQDSRLATYYLSDSMKQDRYNDKIIVEVYGFVEEFIKEFEALREKLNRHSVSLYNETNHLFRLITAVQREIVSRKELLESLKSDIIRQEASERDKDEKIASLQKLIALLYEACTIAVMEIENKSGGKSFINQTLPSSEEKFSAMANRLIFVVKDYSTTFQTEIERSQKEMKATILNLQNELHEKDIQRERVCLELINQIKEAETNSTNLSVDLQSTKRLVNDLEKQVERMETERTKELKEKEATLIQLQEKVKSLTDLLPAKEQGLFYFILFIFCLIERNTLLNERRKHLQ